MIKLENIKIGDWCYIFGDDVFVQISEIEYDSNHNIKNIYAIDEVNGCFMNESLTWICRKEEDPEKIFYKMANNYKNLEKRKIKIK